MRTPVRGDLKRNIYELNCLLNQKGCNISEDCLGCLNSANWFVVLMRPNPNKDDFDEFDENGNVSGN